MHKAPADGFLTKMLSNFRRLFFARNSATGGTEQSGSSDTITALTGKLIGDNRSVLEFRIGSSSLKGCLRPGCSYQSGKPEKRTFDKLLRKQGRTEALVVVMIDDPSFNGDNPDLISFLQRRCSRLITAYQPSDLADNQTRANGAGTPGRTSAEYVATFENANLALRSIVPVDQSMRLYEFANTSDTSPLEFPTPKQDKAA